MRATVVAASAVWSVEVGEKKEDKEEELPEGFTTGGFDNMLGS